MQGKDQNTANGGDFRQRRKVMAGISRKFLTALGIEDDKADEIMTAYSDAISEVKAERDELKSEKQTLKDVKANFEKLKKDYDELKDSMENGKSPYKVKYEAIKEEFEAYKAEQEKAKSHATKAEAFKALLKEIGVADKRIDAVLRVSDIDNLEMDGDSIKDADKVKKAAAEEWADFIETTTTKGAETPKPPANNGGSKMTKEEIFKIKDATERQQAIADNHELFGF